MRCHLGPKEDLKIQWGYINWYSVTGNKVKEVQNLGSQSPALYSNYFELPSDWVSQWLNSQWKQILYRAGLWGYQHLYYFKLFTHFLTYLPNSWGRGGGGSPLYPPGSYGPDIPREQLASAEARFDSKIARINYSCESYILFFTNSRICWLLGEKRRYKDSNFKWKLDRENTQFIEFLRSLADSQTRGHSMTTWTQFCPFFDHHLPQLGHF